MALQMSYSKYGKTYSQSYWRLGDVNISWRDNKAKATFHMYADAAAKTVDVIQGVMDAHHYTIQGNDFATIFDEKNTSKYADIYAYAKACKDTSDGDGEPNKVCFFATAADV